MIFLYAIFGVVSALVGWGVKALGFKHYWLAGIVIFLGLCIAFTLWLNWKIKTGPYP